MVLNLSKREQIKGWLLFLPLFLLAAAVRFWGMGQPYQQDEYKWAQAADPVYHTLQSIPHPPLALFLYNHMGSFIGYENLRFVPAAFSLVLLILLFLYLKSFFSTRAALIGSLLFAVTPYALLGSLQIDIDGVFLPLVALTSFFGYSLWQRALTGMEKKWGLGLLLASLVAGFCFKLSFILVPLVLTLDLVLRNKRARAFVLRKQVLLSMGVALVVIGVLAMLLWNHIWFLRYVDNFVAVHGRDYFEILFLTAKGLVYLSPLLFFGMLLGLCTARLRKELSLWCYFLLANILFYFVIFDFSHRTFDRYLLFLVLPGCVITAVWLDQLLRRMDRNARTQALWFGATFVVTVGVFTWDMFSLSHRVIPLLPKSAFVEAVTHLHWQFLLPMTGGSGPLGFYLPVDALAFLWGFSLVGTFLLFTKEEWVRELGVALLLASAVTYAGFVNSEYLFGTFYGNTGAVLTGLMQTVDSQKDTIQKAGGIITYNDIGAYQLYLRGLYAGRFYPHDQFVEGNRQKFAEHPGYYLVVQMPALGGTSVYTKYFAQCQVVSGKQSGQITGFLYDCSRADPGVIRLLAQ